MNSHAAKALQEALFCRKEWLKGFAMLGEMLTEHGDRRR